MAALQEFYSEKDLQQRRFEGMKADVEQQGFHGLLSMDMFTEDWNASQFWVRCYCDDCEVVVTLLMCSV